MSRLLPVGLCVERVYVDRGYRGHKVDDVGVYIAGQRRIKKKSLRYWLKRRSAIEPIIGHMKNDGGVMRNHLLGEKGDKAHALLVGVGFNLRKLLRASDYFLFFFWRFIGRNVVTIF